MVDRFGTVSSGTVSVLDPQTGKTLRKIKTGLHPDKIITDPDKNFVFVANGNDDNVTGEVKPTGEEYVELPVLQ